MKILITGSSGFIGSVLFDQLRRNNFDVHGIDIRPPRWRCKDDNEHHVNIENKQELRSFMTELCPTHIVHLAARTDLSVDSVVHYYANISGIANIIDTAQRAGTVERILWTSSQLVSRIGRIPEHPTDFSPDTSYGESKVIGEQIVRALDGGGMEWAILRPTTVWGPGMSDHYLSLLRYIEKRRYFHAGTDKMPKSYSYIHNTAYQITRLLQASKKMVHSNTFYIADYKPIYLNEWCDDISAAMGAQTLPTIPLWAAKALAIGGDALNATFAPQFKFNRFRLRNILTPYVFDMTNLEAIVGELPHDYFSAIKDTVYWYYNKGNPSNVGVK